jgi:hypothetical protein
MAEAQCLGSLMRRGTMPGADKPSFKERLAAGAKVALEKAQEGKEKLAEVKAEHDAKPKEYKFAGVKLIGTERVESKQGGGSVHGAKATVETLGQIRGRRTVKTLGLHQKKIDERQVYLTIVGRGWEISVEVNPEDGTEAREFAARINSAGMTVE